MLDPEVIQMRGFKNVVQDGRTTGFCKLIVDRATSTAQLFALPGDPLERDNLAGREPALLQAMSGELEQLERALGNGN